MSDSGARTRAPSWSPSRILSLREVRWFELDWHVLGLALFMLVMGLVFIHAMSDADQAFGRAGEAGAVSFKSHAQKVLVAAPALFIGMALRSRWLRRNAYLIYGICICMLLLVEFIGDVRNGSRRWIQLPIGFDLQPSELAKIGVIVALGRTLYRNRLQRLKDWGPPLSFALVPMGLVALQPDLGTALTIVPVTLGMLYLAGARARVLGFFIAGVAALGFASWQLEIGVRDYQLQRIQTWTEGFRAQDLIDAKSGPAFHTYQARTVIGHGGLTGTGIGAGVANEAGYLPERDCDSVFAVVAEELGWFGTSAILLAYATMITLMMGSAAQIRDRFARLVVGGIALYFAAHLIINVSVNLGLMPLTGLTWPLFSTGGSSLLTTFLALGLALGLAAQREPSLDEDSFRA